MNYRYIPKNHISEHETMIVRDYFETPIENPGSHLDHITHICQYYNISAPLLSVMVSNFRVFDTQTHCSQCHIMRQIYEPIYQFQQQNFKWICDDCHQFLQQQFNSNFSLPPIQDEYNDYPF